VEPAVFEIVSGHTIDQNGDVALAETADVDARIASATGVRTSVNRRRAVQNQRNIAGTKLCSDGVFAKLRKSNRGFARDGLIGEGFHFSDLERLERHDLVV